MRKHIVNLNTKKSHRFAYIGLAAIATGLILTVQTPTLASEYSIEITPEMQRDGTDGMVDEDGNVTDTSSRISIGNGILYDSQEKRYMYPVGTEYVYSNVLDQMITQNDVTITADAGVEYTVYLNGDAVDISDDSTVDEAGSYTVMTGKSGSQTEAFSFTIVGSAINQPDVYELPSTCVTTKVAKDGAEVSSDTRSIDLSEEGHYVIEYMCVRNDITYSLDFTVDHTAPTLTLDGVKGNKARGKVTIKDIEDGTSITIEKDGSDIKARTQITQPGSYTVRATDQAGNSTVYSFYILFYLNAGGITFLILAVVGVAAVAVYLYISRKRMRIR